MSKTVATCIAETNLVQGDPQENVFFLTLSRKIEDFPNEFLRTARSTSPIQDFNVYVRYRGRHPQSYPRRYY